MADAAATMARQAAERGVIRVSGAEARAFLHDLVTSDVEKLGAGEARYAALLTPQGKYLADFILVGEPDAVLIDVAADQAAALAQRLMMYRLRRKIGIEAAGLGVVQLWGPGAAEAAEAAALAGALCVADPRDAALGLRIYAADPAAAEAACLAAGAAQGDRAAWDALRIDALVPEAGAELTPDSYILECGFERLHGVDFRKGCYVGQEIVARMKHKTELRRGLVAVEVTGAPPAPGTELRDEAGRPAGILGTVAGGRGLAVLRFDRAEGEMRAADAAVRRV